MMGEALMNLVLMELLEVDERLEPLTKGCPLDLSNMQDIWGVGGLLLHGTTAVLVTAD